MSLPLRSSASAGAGACPPGRGLRKGESAVAPGPAAGGSSSSLEGELEGELERQGSHSAGPRGAPGAWQLLPARSAFCPLRSSPALAASVGRGGVGGHGTGGGSRRPLGAPKPPPAPPHYAPPDPPFSVRRRKESLRFRRRLKPLSSSSLPGEPGIMLVCGEGGGG